jgi:hypothetical protein
MKKIMWLMVLCMVPALAAPVWAQPGPGMGGGGMGPRLYNPQTVTTVKGQVEKLEEINMGRQRVMTLMEVLLKTDQGILRVHLGPSRYLKEQKFAVKAGDTLEATGSKVTLNNQPALIAREVKVNGKTLKLRDDQGFPVWRGMGRGSGMGPGMGQGMGPGSGQGQGPGSGPAPR